MDIVAYSELPTDKQTVLVAQLQSIVSARPEFVGAKQSGQLISLPTGDGMALVFFGDPEAPVRCALGLGRAFRNYPEIKVRMGMHTGPVYRVADINANRNVAGGGINVAQRVMNCGDAGHILVSSAAAEVVRELSDWAGLLHDLGEAEVKHGLRVHLFNLYSGEVGNPARPRPLRRRQSFRRYWLSAAIAAAFLLAVAVPYLQRIRMSQRDDRPRIESLAVLPLENLSGDPAQDYLASGLHEALITDLAKLSGFRRVIARSSVKRFEKTTLPPQQIARELGVDALLTGTVLRSGNRLQITAHLITAEDIQIWSQRYDREFQDVLSLQNEIVSGLTNGIKLQLTPQEQSLLAQTPSFNPGAYEAYLKGRFFVGKGTPEGFERGSAYLLDAIRKDPANPLAYSRLALAYTEAGHETLPDAFAQAKSAARKALELDPNSAEAYEVLAETKLYNDWDDWPGAEQNFQRALKLNPNLAAAHRNYSWYLHLMGRSDQALTEMQKAIELDPMSPLLHEDLGYQFWDLHQEEKALGEQRRALEIDPSFPVAYWVLACIHGETGRYAEAIAASEKAAQGDPELRWLLAVSYARAGRKSAALSLAAEIKKQPSPMSEFGLATFYATVGSREEALAWLERSFQDRFSLLPWLRRRGTGVQRPFDPYWSDQRYQSLLRQMKLPQ